MSSSQVEQLRERDCSEDADAGGEGEHEPDHDAREVDGRQRVQHDEHALVVDVLEREGMNTQLDQMFTTFILNLLHMSIENPKLNKITGDIQPEETT